MNRFTMRLHGSGWLVKDFLEYWQISRKTYERISVEPKRYDILNKKIKAMGCNQEITGLVLANEQQTIHGQNLELEGSDYPH